jgi:hypothetical protein
MPEAGYHPRRGGTKAVMCACWAAYSTFTVKIGSLSRKLISLVLKSVTMFAAVKTSDHAFDDQHAHK